MTREGGAAGAPHRHSDEELAWIGERLTQLRQSVAGQRIALQRLGIGFALSLAAYVSRYALKASATTEPFRLVADLLYALGWALWTGVVVALFVETIPQVKQRQITQALDDYEAALREQPRSRSGSGSAQPSRGDA